MTSQSDFQKIKFSSNGSNTQLLERGLAVQELISNKPGFLIRWGITIFLIILLLITGATWFIKYPDIVTANAKLTSVNAPKAVITNSGGQLTRLFVKEGDPVQKGQVIGYMESTAYPETVLHLSKALDSVQNLFDHNKTGEAIKTFTSLFSNRKKPGAALGELQQPYQTFVQSFMQFQGYLSNGFYLRKKAMLVNDMVNLQRMNANLQRQKILQEQDLDLAQQTYRANEQLKDDSVISAFEYRNESSKLISKKMSLPQTASSIVSNEGSQNEKRKEILELEDQISQQKNIFVQALNTFVSQVEAWKKKYLLTAPVDGRIAFPGFVQEHQQVHPDQIICYVNAGTSQYYAEIYIPQFNLGKVRTGQQVLLKLPSYPYQEYGSLAGKIEFISTIPTDIGYRDKVVLPDGFITNNNKSIQYRDGLVAQGEIITENMRLLERFYYNIIKQIRK